ncbi:MAG: hypothetical protein HeimC3_07090 [Candidatus Heimdallarchaeota archaeon LC_3]|nr:MAG: hypothetical protein HeimC3_07090 [Candidatus Heimdallarchaeota archaeon LC_3]
MEDNDSLKELKAITNELKEIKTEIALLNKNFSNLFEQREIGEYNLIPEKFEKKSIDFKACIDTLDAIKKFESIEKRGASAQELATIRDLSRPTIYSHLEDLEKSDLVFVLRGNNIDLKPSNSNFYYSKVRDPSQTIWNFNILSSLDSEAQKISNLIMRSDENGISHQEIVTKLSFNGKLVTKELKKLLKQALITYQIIGSEHKYYALGLKSE